ncbi:hypothetical protein AB5I41_15880 [Sphingomonas sp. MMS24-JH45]
MDILFLAHRVPFPPDRGDRIRSFHVLRHLAARARVHLVAFAECRRGGRCAGVPRPAGPVHRRAAHQVAPPLAGGGAGDRTSGR